jgi:hypothetical protein
VPMGLRAASGLVVVRSPGRTCPASSGPCFGLEPPLVRSWAVMAAGATTDCGKSCNRSTLSRRHAAGGATGSISSSP